MHSSSASPATDNKYKCITDQELLLLCQADAWCSLTRRQHFSAPNDVMAAIMKV